MAAIERARPQGGSQTYEASPSPLQASPPQAEIAKLAALHREAEETAHLANLLGRAPYAAAGLTLAVLSAAAWAFSSMPAIQIGIWIALMALALGAVARSYARAIRAPFERAPLVAFAYDLAAILAYAGFAWGVGAFLVLPASAGPLAAVVFAALPPALIAATLRTRDTALLFLGPATLLSTFAMVLRPLADGALAAAVTLAAAGVVAGIMVWLARSQASGRLGLAVPPFGENTAL